MPQTPELTIDVSDDPIRDTRLIELGEMCQRVRDILIRAGFTEEIPSPTNETPGFYVEPFYPPVSRWAATISHYDWPDQDNLPHIQKYAHALEEAGLRPYIQTFEYHDRPHAKIKVYFTLD